MTEEAIHCFIAHRRMGGAAIRIIPPSRLPGTRCSAAMSGNQRRKVGFQKCAIQSWAATPPGSVFGSTLLSRIWRPAAAINDCWRGAGWVRAGKSGEKNSPRWRKGGEKLAGCGKKECIAEGVSNVSCHRCGYSTHSGG